MLNAAISAWRDILPSKHIRRISQITSRTILRHDLRSDNHNQWRTCRVLLSLLKKKREMNYKQQEIGDIYGHCKSTAWHYMHGALQMLQEEMEVLLHWESGTYFSSYMGMYSDNAHIVGFPTGEGDKNEITADNTFLAVNSRKLQVGLKLALYYGGNDSVGK